MKVAKILLATSMLAAGCGGEEDTSETAQAVGGIQHYSDAAHLPGTAGFYIFPNIVDTQPAVSGTFNAGFRTRTSVDVNQMDCTTWAFMATVSSVSNPVAYNDVPGTPGHYRINTTTAGLNMTLGSCYRVAFKLDNALLGYRDVKVLLTTQTAPTDIKKIVNGSTISLKWRLEGSVDQDNDTILNHVDNCPTVANTNQLDSNGNGIGDACDQSDADNDGVYDTADNCVNVANSDQANTDGDSVGDACDACPADALKTTSAGACGCGVAETDSDNDGAPNCIDGCAADPGKTGPGVCGCGIADTDGDTDGTADCVDGCPLDSGKVSPGVCGCGVSDVDSDSDGLADCLDGCPLDSGKTAAGQCGCGVPDTDSDADGRANCLETCTP